MDTYEIRDAQQSDCGQILQLLRELAEYEKMPDDVHITEKDLMADGFGEDKFYHALVVQPKPSGHIIGYALFFYTYSTWDGRAAQLEDIYVRDQYRKLGIGTKLIRAVAKTIRTKGCNRLDLHILDWNTPSLDFYKNLGGIDLTVKEGWNLVRFGKEALDRFCES